MDRLARAIRKTPIGADRYTKVGNLMIFLNLRVQTTGKPSGIRTHQSSLSSLRPRAGEKCSLRRPVPSPSFDGLGAGSVLNRRGG